MSGAPRKTLISSPVGMWWGSGQPTPCHIPTGAAIRNAAVTVSAPNAASRAASRRQKPTGPGGVRPGSGV